MSCRSPIFLLLLCGALCGRPAPARARAFAVRLLEGTEQNGVWGTNEYRVRVTALGTLRNLEVHGRKVMAHAGALYTAPIPPEGGKPIRTVQGEGVGARGLSIEAPERDTRDRNGTRIFHFRHKIAKPGILDGQTLCVVDQTITLTPTGEITNEYDCSWQRTCRWDFFMVLLFFDSKLVGDCPFMGLRGEHIFTGRLDLHPPAGDPARLWEPLEQLTIRTAVGPIHVLWDAPLPTSLTWRNQVQLRTWPREIPRRGRILRGTRGHIAFRLLLPVSQQGMVETKMKSK